MNYIIILAGGPRPRTPDYLSRVGLLFSLFFLTGENEKIKMKSAVPVIKKKKIYTSRNGKMEKYL